MRTDLYRSIDGIRIFKCYAMSSREQLQTWGGVSVFAFRVKQSKNK